MLFCNCGALLVDIQCPACLSKIDESIFDNVVVKTVSRPGLFNDFSLNVVKCAKG